MTEPSAQQRLDVALGFFTPAMRDEYDVLVAALPPAPAHRCKFSSTCEFSHNVHDTTTQSKGEVW